MTVAKKRSQTVAKNGTLQKWLWPKKSKPNSVGKKMRLIKMTVTKKSEPTSWKQKNGTL